MDAADNDPSTTLAGGFRIGNLRIDPPTGDVTGPGGQEQLDPKVMGVLVVLAERPGAVVSREDLLARLWPDVVVSDDALTRCLSELRRQLAAAGGDEGYRDLVETLPKRGYRLIGEVATLEPPRPAATQRRLLAWAGGAIALLLAAGGAWLAWRSPPAGASVAVLPFVDMSERKDQGYFSDGVAEEILNQLAQSPDLRVISRTSSFVFRGRSADVAAIAARLDVTHVLEGSVRKAGDRVRITAQLIEAGGESHVWSETYDRKLGDIFAIQDDIAESVASALQTTLKLERRPARRPASFEAYDLVKQGEYYYWRRAPGDMERAMKLFEEAVEVDPGYAIAWADLAGAYALLAWVVDPPDAILRARQGNAALRAVELDPNLAIAHRRLGQYYDESGDDAKFREHQRIAEMLDPENPLILSDQAWRHVRAGEISAAIELQQRALVRDPVNTVSMHNLGIMLVLGNRLDEALAAIRKLLQVNPGAGPESEIEISRILVLQGKYDEAAEAARRLSPDKYRDEALALLAASPSHGAEAGAALARLEAFVSAPPWDIPDHTIIHAVRLAEAYVIRGMKDEAFAALDRERASLEQRNEAQAYLWILRNEASISPFLGPLRDDPRWAAYRRTKTD